VKASLLPCAVAIVATVVASSSAASSRPAARESSAPDGTLKRQLTTVVVPLRVQRVLKKGAPRAAYVPTRLLRGYRYHHYENLNRRGFDVFFTCCGDNLAWIGFDADLVKRSEPCDQGTALKVFRIDGVVVAWNAGHNDQQAWRCVRRGGTRLLLTVTGAASRDGGTSWRTPRQLAEMVASARPIG
jgi:hypothetical protein